MLQFGFTPSSDLHPSWHADDSAGFSIVQIDLAPGQSLPALHSWCLFWDEPILELSFARDTGQLMRLSYYDLLSATNTSALFHLALQEGHLICHTHEIRANVSSGMQVFNDGKILQIKLRDQPNVTRLGSKYFSVIVDQDKKLVGFEISLTSKH